MGGGVPCTGRPRPALQRAASPRGQGVPDTLPQGSGLRAERFRVALTPALPGGRESRRSPARGATLRVPRDPFRRALGTKSPGIGEVTCSAGTHLPSRWDWLAQAGLRQGPRGALGQTLLGISGRSRRSGSAQVGCALQRPGHPLGAPELARVPCPARAGSPLPSLAPSAGAWGQGAQGRCAAQLRALVPGEAAAPPGEVPASGR